MYAEADTAKDTPPPDRYEVTVGEQGSARRDFDTGGTCRVTFIGRQRLGRPRRTR